MQRRQNILNSNEKTRPIGVFDSGVGGISVLKELYKLMPNETYLFYGDSKNAPYGVKDKEEVFRLSHDIVEKFIQLNVKAIVIACNTATSAAIDRLRKEFSEVIFVGLEPSVKPAIQHKSNSEVVVMATKLTLREKKFAELISQYEDQANIIRLPAPDLVEFIEHGDTNSPALYKYLNGLLEPYKGNVDSIVLGCTHFPFARAAIQKIVGPNVFITDGAFGAAARLKSQLDKYALRNDCSKKGKVQFYNSNPDPREIQLSKKLFLAQ